MSLQPRCCAHTRISSGSELRDVRREGASAVVPGPVSGLPGCVHHQHDHVLQRRPGFLRPHPQTQTRSHVSSTETRSLDNTERSFVTSLRGVSAVCVLHVYNMNCSGEEGVSCFYLQLYGGVKQFFDEREQTSASWVCRKSRSGKVDRGAACFYIRTGLYASVGLQFT